LIAYLDTSVVAAYYLPESLSKRVEDAIVRIDRPAISRLVEVEFASVVSRKLRNRELSREGAREVLSNFHADRSAGRYRLAELLDEHYLQARHWIETLGVALRTLDALHLAVSSSAALPLLTADRQLAAAAKALGVKSRLITG